MVRTHVPWYIAAHASAICGEKRIAHARRRPFYAAVVAAMPGRYMVSRAMPPPAVHNGGTSYHTREDVPQTPDICMETDEPGRD